MMSKKSKLNQVTYEFSINNQFDTDVKNSDLLKLIAASHLRRQINSMTDVELAELIHVNIPKKIQQFVKDYVHLEGDKRFISKRQVRQARKYLNELLNWSEFESDRGEQEAQTKLENELDKWFSKQKNKK